MQVFRSSPEFLNGSLLLPGDSHMAGVVERKEEDIPVGTEPGNEEGAGEGFKGALDHLSSPHPGRRHTQDHQQAT